MQAVQGARQRARQADARCCPLVPGPLILGPLSPGLLISCPLLPGPLLLIPSSLPFLLLPHSVLLFPSLSFSGSRYIALTPPSLPPAFPSRRLRQPQRRPRCWRRSAPGTPGRSRAPPPGQTVVKLVKMWSNCGQTVVKLPLDPFAHPSREGSPAPPAPLSPP